MWREWLSYRHWVYVIRYRLAGYARRAVYGWSPVDTWSLDKYVANVMAPSLRHLAQHAHGYPMWILDEYPEFTDFNGDVDDEAALEAWKHWLIEKATWFEWYAQDDIGIEVGMSDDQKLIALNRYEERLNRFKVEVLTDMAKHFDSLWD